MQRSISSSSYMLYYVTVKVNRAHHTVLVDRLPVLQILLLILYLYNVIS
jgi:hypothetical protein